MQAETASNTALPAETVAARVATVVVRPVRRTALLICGSLSLGLGVLGIFVPLLPTTCFLLLAAWCYARSSPRLYEKLLATRWIGDYLRRYRDERAIPRPVKTASLVMMWITIGYSVFVFPNIVVRAVLLAIAIAVTVHLVKLPTARERGD